MRTLMIGLIAAAGIAIAAPAFADSVSVGVGGARVGVGVHEHDRDIGERRVIREHRREHVTVGVGERERHCKMIVVHREGMTKKIKKCD